MTMRARIVAAGLVVLSIVGGLTLYLLWPRWYGVEVLMPVTLGTVGGPNGGLVTDFPDSRLQLDATNTLAASRSQRSPYVDIRSVGVVWDSRRDPREEAARLRHQIVYLQLKKTEAAAGTGEPLSRPFTISTTPVSGVTNLRVMIVSANSAAQVDVGISGGRLPLPQGAALDHAAAILKVLPSGRHAIVGVIAGGQRVVF